MLFIDKNRKTRVNGVQWPFHIFQVMTWVEWAIQATVVTAFIFKITDSEYLQKILGSIHLTTLSIVWLLAYFCTTLDPMD